ncbi:MAG: pyridoxamine 5'-phosphate oxidase [Saprospiraceae bacterium]|jgi:pyridoxamine 5'-phosphate oxidase|nr:pyridoxamine 5'-phosphate oxidase [Saprospiraceae bacterium]
MLNIQDLREDYSKQSLDESDIVKNPFQQFKVWFEEAMKAKIPEPNAFTLATADLSGQPSARIVLLKSFDEAGFVFYTNYNSRKGAQLAANPKAAMTFLWHELQRQIRIEGKVVKVPSETSNAYFKSRPKASQIGAWASPQSQVINNRTLLENNVQALQKEYKDTDALPRPEHWGGFLLQPKFIEFWQGRPSRLHDRIAFELDGSQKWHIKRLAP